MDPRHLTLLRELAERGSVAAVAAAGHRSPSAVSQQLRTAERDLGVRLVEPDGRGVRLTAAGRLMAACATDVETVLTRTRAKLDDLVGRAEGTVRVAALPSAMEYLLPPVLVALADEPITIELEDIDVAETDYAAQTADADIVIGHSLTGKTPAGSEHLVRTVLCREPIDVALPVDHPLTRKRNLRAEDVVGEPWVGVPEGYPFETIRLGVEAATGRRTDVRQRVRDNHVVAALVAAGQGVALLPRFTTHQEDGVVLRPLVDVDAVRWVVALSRRDRAERAVVRRVVSHLRRAAPRA